MPQTVPCTVLPLSAVTGSYFLPQRPLLRFMASSLICGHPAFSGCEFHCEPQCVLTGSPPHVRPHEGPPAPPCGFHAMVAIHQQEPIAELEHHHWRHLIQDLRKP